MLRRCLLAAVIALAATVTVGPAALARYGGAGAAPGQGGSDCPARPAPGAKILNGVMDGRVEVPPGDPDGTGQVTLWLEGDKVWFKLAWEGIDPPNLAHVHRAPLGQAGEPVIPLFQGAPRRQGCVAAPAAAVAKVAADPAAYYVNVHNQRHPKGAVRAQLEAGERPVLPFTGTGSARLLLAGSLVSAAGMTLVMACRRSGVRIARHLATQGAPARSRPPGIRPPGSRPRVAARARRQPAPGGLGAAGGVARSARRWDDSPW